MIISESWPLTGSAFLLLSYSPLIPVPPFSSYFPHWSLAPFFLLLHFSFSWLAFLICFFMVIRKDHLLIASGVVSQSGVTVVISGRKHINWCSRGQSVGGFSLPALNSFKMCWHKDCGVVCVTDEEIGVGMSWGLKAVDVTAHPLLDLLSRPCTFVLVFSPPPPFLLSAVLYSESWHGTLAPGDYLSIPPFLSSFFPPTEPFAKSFPLSLIPLLLLHRHNTSSTQTNYRCSGDLSCRRSVWKSSTMALTVV